jgi:hypothetical protein
MAQPDLAEDLLISAAREGSVEALGKAFQACRNYLLLIAAKELDPDLQARGGLPTWSRRRSWRPGGILRASKGLRKPS